MVERDAYHGKPVKSSSGTFMGVNTIYRTGTGGKYMTRAWIGRLRLHIFHRGDEDPDPHDHPWDFWTFPLTSYVEEVLSPIVAQPLQNTKEIGHSGNGADGLKTLQIVPAFRWSFRPATHCHRVLGAWTGAYEHSIADVRPEVRYGQKLVTIIWRSQEYRKWGFLKNRDGRWCWIAWRDYVLGGGKNGPCA